MDQKVEVLMKLLSLHTEELAATAKRCESEPVEKCPVNISERAMAAKLALHLMREAFTEKPAPLGKAAGEKLGEAEEE